jgi:hypothetical protein
MVRDSLRWSVVAGLAAFLFGTVTLVVLSPLATVLADLLNVPAAYSTVMLSGPAAVVGAIVWWASVEQATEYSYVRGVAFGVLTALGTIVVWLGVYSVVWGPKLVATGWILIAFVGVATVPVALLVGVVVMYARRELTDGLPTGEPAPSESG